MTLRLVRPSPPASVVMVGVCLLLLGGGAWHQASAGCIDYQNYLRLMGSLDVGAVAGNVDVQGDYAYVTLRLNGVQRLLVMDISNEYAPRHAGHLDFDAPPYGVAVNDSIALVSMLAYSGDGLSVVDIKDPTSPTLISSCLADQVFNCVRRVGDIAYLTASEPPYAFVVIDVSDPANPDSLYSIPLPGQPGRRFIVRGNYAYVATRATQLITFDISSPENPIIVDEWITTGRTSVDLAVNGDELFLTFTRPAAAAELARFWLTPYPDDPQWHNGCPLTGIDYWPIVTAGNDVCYVGSDYSTVRMIDVSTESCVPLGTLHYPDGYIANLVVHDYSLFYCTRSAVTDTGIVHIFSISSPEPLVPISNLATPGTAEDVAVAAGRADIAYVADGAAGLQVVDVSDPLNPVIITSLDTPGYAVNVALQNSVAFVADSGAGVVAIDVAAPTSPVAIDTFDTPGSAVDIALSPTHAFVADTESGVHVINIETPSAMFYTGIQDTLTASTGIDVAGSYAYVADEFDGLVVLNVEDPSNPWIIEGVKDGILDSALRVDHDDGRVYVTVPDSGLYVVDVTDPTHPVVESDVGTLGAAGDVDVAGIFAYVGTGTGMQLLDIQDGGNPLPAGNMVGAAETHGIFIDQYYAYIAGGESLYVCPAQCGFDQSVLAAFAPNTYEENIPFTIDFTNLSEGYGLYYDWDFGDGVGTSTERHPSYTFENAGNFTVTLIATNGVHSDTATASIRAIDPTLSEAPAAPEAVTSVQLGQAVPNPFNPSTTLHYALPKTDPARLAIYDVSGRLVRVLVNEVVPAGRHQTIWHGKDDTGHRVASGTYFSRLEAGGVVRIGRMVLLK
ncbi:MAG: PKD domain-containing protein [bacterium]